MQRTRAWFYPEKLWELETEGLGLVAQKLGWWELERLALGHRKGVGVVVWVAGDS